MKYANAYLALAMLVLAIGFIYVRNFGLAGPWLVFAGIHLQLQGLERGRK